MGLPHVLHVIITAKFGEYLVLKYILIKEKGSEFL
ncbi:unnamed protein product [Spirodela intermedia]|uniref:Uncharacterized protein n=2 Tax=Spirodela intermedia TaxID=51605 RepID=A0A7I8ID47_SPIIN|nr:unnamed protein product [Spirodela intermedia]CAA6654771.1 unnamed protein product [Spirodela intermedia]CAA7389440.1 unnamed protein product [Spirodela intermedia]